MSVQSKLLMLFSSSKFRRRTFYGVFIIGAAVAIQQILAEINSRKVKGRNEPLHGASVKVKSKEAAIDRKFIHQLCVLLKIMIPGLFSKECGVIGAHSLILASRTFLSIYVASLEGRMVKAIVQKDILMFAWQLCTWIMIAIPATFINSMIRFFESYLGLMFRSRLTEFAYKQYFSDQTYYQVSNLDTRLTNADQCLTEDVTMFSQSVAHLYSHLTKPVLDILLISITLIMQAKRRGAGGILGAPMLMASVLVLGTARILKKVSPKFGDMVAEEARLKGQLRYLHSRVIANSEEIAFYGGHEAEQCQLSRAFSKLKEQMILMYRKKIPYVMIEQFLMKYVWSATGMTMIALPILTAEFANDERSKRLDDLPDRGVSERTKGFTTAKNLLLSSADAAERLMTSYKEIIELAGYSSRVHQMFHVFAEVKAGRYSRSLAEGSLESRRERFDTSIITGIEVETEDFIRLRDVPIVTPSGDVIVRSMSIEIMPNMHVLITGPNGCGKSSLFRILGGLWPVYRGTVERPSKSKMFYIPQRPYMTLGTLRDQVIYPDTARDMGYKGITDDDLVKILEIVNLSHIIEREGGWSSRNDWMDVLSGGEKQRIGLARVFYHRPLYALLDECTSAVSIDVEGQIYEAIKQANITLLTVTHRPSLWKFHTHLLQYDGEGGYSMSLLPPSIKHRISLADEKRQIEERLSDVPLMKKRLKELCETLGDDVEEVDGQSSCDEETISR